MKKTSIYISLFLLIVVFSCKEKKTSENEIKGDNTESKVVFKIDERTEFFRTIFNIAAQDVLPKEIRPCQTEYLKRVNKHFLQFKNHPLIKWVYDDDNVKIDFSTIGLMYKDLEKFEFDTIYLKELKNYGINKKTLDSVRPLMIDFYKKSKFEKFFKSNESYYKKSLSKINEQVNNEKILNKVTAFYQSDIKGLELIVFIELTNNANNKAVRFYDHYNPKKRAVILANICDSPNKPTSDNEILELNNDIKSRLYHELSHLFTDKFLDKYIGNIKQYKSLCKDCNNIQLKDKIDHMIVFPLQATLSKRLDNYNEGNDFYLYKCKDVRKNIYIKLSEYKPHNGIPFEQIYAECINLIKQSASKK